MSDTNTIPRPGEVVETGQQARDILSMLLGDAEDTLGVLWLTDDSRGLGVFLVESCKVEEIESALDSLAVIGADAGVHRLVAWHPANPDQVYDQFCMELSATEPQTA